MQLSVGVVLALPRQEIEGNNRLDEPLSDPELRKTLLRVFAESLRAAAEAGVAVGNARSASNVRLEGENMSQVTDIACVFLKL